MLLKLLPKVGLIRVSREDFPTICDLLKIKGYIYHSGQGGNGTIWTPDGKKYVGQAPAPVGNLVGDANIEEPGWLDSCILPDLPPEIVSG